MNAALILSGGIGTRFQSALPKQYHRISGKMVIAYVLDAALKEAGSLDLVVVAGADCPELRRLKRDYGFVTAPAGKVRNETLKNGLDELNRRGCDRVIILDAVRPLVNGKLIDDYMRLLSEGWDAVSTAQPITDSLGCLDLHEVDRSRYHLLQSPEAYDFRLLYRYFDPASPLTEVAQQLPKESRLYLYWDFPQNPKLTYPWEKRYIAQAIRAHKQDVQYQQLLQAWEKTYLAQLFKARPQDAGAAVRLPPPLERFMETDLGQLLKPKKKQ